VGNQFFKNIPEIIHLREGRRKWGDMILGVFFQNAFIFAHDEKLFATTVIELDRTLVRGEEVALPIV
jgi:hypothetical protein